MAMEWPVVLRRQEYGQDGAKKILQILEFGLKTAVLDLGNGHLKICPPPPPHVSARVHFLKSRGFNADVVDLNTCGVECVDQNSKAPAFGAMISAVRNCCKNCRYSSHVSTLFDINSASFETCGPIFSTCLLMPLPSLLHQVGMVGKHPER